MPKPAHADGPWGEAIRYWLNAKKMLQADLARTTGIEPKTVSSVTRGFHTTTRILQRIAEALDVPLDAVLVSPDRKSANEARRQMVFDITEKVLRSVEATQLTPALPTVSQAVDNLVAATDRAEEDAAAAKRRPTATTKVNLRRKHVPRRKR